MEHENDRTAADAAGWLDTIRSWRQSSQSTEGEVSSNTLDAGWLDMIRSWRQSSQS
jgi:hypothetical protein